jgi:Mimiviridae putative metallopeptidase WLM domain protein
MTYVKSDVDDKFYLVRDVEDKQKAANMLGKIMQNIIKLSDHLYENKDKYKDMEEYIELFHSKVPNIVLLESTQDSAYTSYAVNKGEQIVFCLRTKRTGNELHDLNLVMYVVLHEASHTADPYYDNHGPIFRKIFAFLTKRAIEIGLYKKVDYRTNPEEYCGMDITESIV